MSGNTRCQPIVCWGDHCSVPGTCPRQTAATAQVFSVGRGFLQARSDLGSQHTLLSPRSWNGWFGLAAPAWQARAVISWNALPRSSSLSLSRPDCRSWSRGGGRKHWRQETQVLWCGPFHSELSHYQHRGHMATLLTDVVKKERIYIDL